MTTFTWDELRAEAEREVAMRKIVYPRLAQYDGQVNAENQLRIDKMQAIAAHFAELAKKERLL